MPVPIFVWEIKDGTKAKIVSFTALVILHVLDFASACENVYTSVNIFIEVQALLCFRDPTMGCHVHHVQEIGMSIMQISTNPCHQASGKRTEHLFLSSSKITQDTNILGENVFTSANNGNGWLVEVLVVPMSIKGFGSTLCTLRTWQEHSGSWDILQGNCPGWHW